MVCTTRQPDCRSCPLRPNCLAFQRGVQEERPRRKRRRLKPHYEDCAAILSWDGRYLIRRRAQEGLLGQLWEFPGGRRIPSESPAASLERRLRQDLGMRIRPGERVLRLEQTYSHFRITRHAFVCPAPARPIRAKSPVVRWVRPAQFKDFPMGKIDRQIADWILRNQAGRRPERQPV